MKRILFVDDSAEVCEMSKEYLGSAGFEVSVAHNGRQALERLSRWRPDLVITDLLMPVMDGFELCHAIKSVPESAAIPVLFYTSTFLDGPERELATALGASCYLIKPMRLADLLETINTVLASELPPQPDALPRQQFDRRRAAILAGKLQKRSGDLERAKEEIERRNASFTHLVNAIREPLLEFSGDLRVVYGNDVSLAWLGIELGQLHGMRAAGVLGGGFHELLRNYAGGGWERGELHADVAITMLEGRSVECRVTLLKDESGIDERYLALFSPLARGLERGALTLVRETATTGNAANAIIGSSTPVRQLLSEITGVASATSPVLIQGESGTGKELVANAIHALSRCHEGPLVKVNCGAIPAGLFESELFGHERGAFSGAEYRRIGRFEQASGGTLFLDEVTELTAEMQVKLLRVLQEGVIERVGSSTPVKVDVRIVAATNSDVERCVREGSFRLDLYYRLNVLPLIMPSLRQHPEDIPLLAEHFLRRYAARNGKMVHSISEAALRRLQSHPWPGNVRELQNVLERAVIVARGSVIQPGDIRLPESALPVAGGGQTLAEIETAHIIDVLAKTRGAIAGPGGAAELLGMNPSTLRSRMKKYGIQRPTH